MEFDTWTLTTDYVRVLLDHPESFVVVIFWGWYLFSRLRGRDPLAGERPHPHSAYAAPLAGVLLGVLIVFFAALASSAIGLAAGLVMVAISGYVFHRIGTQARGAAPDSDGAGKKRAAV